MNVDNLNVDQQKVFAIYWNSVKSAQFPIHIT